MTYSRSRTYRQQRSRSGSRIRRLAVLNLLLLAVVVGVVVWLVSLRHSNGSAFEATAPPSTPDAVSASAIPSPSAVPSLPSPASALPSSSPNSANEAAPAEDGAGESGSSADELPAAGEPAAGGDEEQLTFAFVGDILPAGSVAQLMKKNGYDYPYRQARSLLQAADITAGNLEAPITERGAAAKNKQYLFRGPVQALPALKDAGFDVFTLANNHTLDYGWVGLQDTMDALDDHKLKHMGSGADDTEAFTPVYMERKGMTVAFIGASHVLPEPSWKAAADHPGVADAYNSTQVEKAIREAKQQADLVVVMVHWGFERADRPDQVRQVNLAHRLIDAGADLVIGSHPHVLQGFESYKNKWIAYSLGNFVFNATASPKTSETGVLNATCAKDGNCSLAFHPMLAVQSQPAPMSEQAAKALLARLSSVSAAAVFKENGNLVAKR